MNDLKHILIVNNTRHDIGVIHEHLISYAQTGKIHEDIADIFELGRLIDNGQIRVIVNFREDDED